MYLHIVKTQRSIRPTVKKNYKLFLSLVKVNLYCLVVAVEIRGVYITLRQRGGAGYESDARLLGFQEPVGLQGQLGRWGAVEGQGVVAGLDAVLLQGGTPVPGGPQENLDPLNEIRERNGQFRDKRTLNGNAGRESRH